MSSLFRKSKTSKSKATRMGSTNSKPTVLPSLTKQTRNTTKTTRTKSVGSKQVGTSRGNSVLGKLGFSKKVRKQHQYTLDDIIDVEPQKKPEVNLQEYQMEGEAVSMLSRTLLSNSTRNLSIHEQKADKLSLDDSYDSLECESDVGSLEDMNVADAKQKNSVDLEVDDVFDQEETKLTLKPSVKATKPPKKAVSKDI